MMGRNDDKNGFHPCETLTVACKEERKRGEVVRSERDGKLYLKVRNGEFGDEIPILSYMEHPSFPDEIIYLEVECIEHFMQRWRSVFYRET